MSGGHQLCADRSEMERRLILPGRQRQERNRGICFSPDTLQYKTAQMYIDGFNAKLEHDTSYKGLWTVNFTLNEF